LRNSLLSIPLLVMPHLQRSRFGATAKEEI
jgi:hypothetical protein